MKHQRIARIATLGLVGLLTASQLLGAQGAVASGSVSPAEEQPLAQPVLYLADHFYSQGKQVTLDSFATSFLIHPRTFRRLDELVLDVSPSTFSTVDAQVTVEQHTFGVVVGTMSMDYQAIPNNGSFLRIPLMLPMALGNEYAVTVHLKNANVDGQPWALNTYPVFRQYTPEESFTPEGIKQSWAMHFSQTGLAHDSTNQSPPVTFLVSDFSGADGLYGIPEGVRYLQLANMETPTGQLSAIRYGATLAWTPRKPVDFLSAGFPPVNGTKRLTITGPRGPIMAVTQRATGTFTYFPIPVGAQLQPGQYHEVSLEAAGQMELPTFQLHPQYTGDNEHYEGISSISQSITPGLGKSSPLATKAPWMVLTVKEKQ